MANLYCLPYENRGDVHLFMKKKIVLKFIYIIVFSLFLISCDNIQQSNPNVKKSNTGICHKKGTQYYKQTKNFISFDSLKDCLDSGGRLPR